MPAQRNTTRAVENTTKNIALFGGSTSSDTVPELKEVHDQLAAHANAVSEHNMAKKATMKEQASVERNGKKVTQITRQLYGTKKANSRRRKKGASGYNKNRKKHTSVDVQQTSTTKGLVQELRLVLEGSKSGNTLSLVETLLKMEEDHTLIVGRGSVVRRWIDVLIDETNAAICDNSDEEDEEDQKVKRFGTTRTFSPQDCFDMQEILREVLKEYGSCLGRNSKREICLMQGTEFVKFESATGCTVQAVFDAILPKLESTLVNRLMRATEMDAPERTMTEKQLSLAMTGMGNVRPSNRMNRTTIPRNLQTVINKVKSVANATTAHDEEIAANNVAEPMYAAEEEAVRPREAPMMPRNEAFRVIGIAVTSTEEQIHRAVRESLIRTHPDRGGDAAAFLEVREAQRSLQNVKGIKLLTIEEVDEIKRTAEKMVRVFEGTATRTVTSIVKKVNQVGMMAKEVDMKKKELGSSEMTEYNSLPSVRANYVWISGYGAIGDMVVDKVLFAECKKKQETCEAAERACRAASGDAVRELENLLADAKKEQTCPRANERNQHVVDVMARFGLKPEQEQIPRVPVVVAEVGQRVITEGQERTLGDMMKGQLPATAVVGNIIQITLSAYRGTVSEEILRTRVQTQYPASNLTIRGTNAIMHLTVPETDRVVQETITTLANHPNNIRARHLISEYMFGRFRVEFRPVDANRQTAVVQRMVVANKLVVQQQQAQNSATLVRNAAFDAKRQQADAVRLADKTAKMKAMQQQIADEQALRCEEKRMSQFVSVMSDVETVKPVKKKTNWFAEKKKAMA
jgi:hypothetical protein